MIIKINPEHVAELFAHQSIVALLPELFEKRLDWDIHNEEGMYVPGTEDYKPEVQDLYNSVYDEFFEYLINMAID